MEKATSARLTSYLSGLPAAVPAHFPKSIQSLYKQMDRGNWGSWSHVHPAACYPCNEIYIKRPRESSIYGKDIFSIRVYLQQRPLVFRYRFRRSIMTWTQLIGVYGVTYNTLSTCLSRKAFVPADISSLFPLSTSAGLWDSASRFSWLVFGLARGSHNTPKRRENGKAPNYHPSVFLHKFGQRFYISNDLVSSIWCF